MANKCSLTCNVKDSKNRVKVSSLWSDLANFFKQDRKEAIAHYFLTKNTSFLMENSDVLKFDADGEVTIASLKKALERGGEYSTLSDSKTLERLNEEIKTGRYEYSEALDNVLKFNKQNQFNEDFMATLERQDDGKYLVQVVKRDAGGVILHIKHFLFSQERTEFIVINITELPFHHNTFHIFIILILIIIVRAIVVWLLIFDDGLEHKNLNSEGGILLVKIPNLLHIIGDDIFRL